MRPVQTCVCYRVQESQKPATLSKSWGPGTVGFPVFNSDLKYKKIRVFIGQWNEISRFLDLQLILHLSWTTPNVKTSECKLPVFHSLVKKPFSSHQPRRTACPSFYYESSVQACDLKGRVWGNFTQWFRNLNFLISSANQNSSQTVSQQEEPHQGQNGPCQNVLTVPKQVICRLQDCCLFWKCSRSGCCRRRHGHRYLSG